MPAAPTDNGKTSQFNWQQILKCSEFATRQVTRGYQSCNLALIQPVPQCETYVLILFEWPLYTGRVLININLNNQTLSYDQHQSHSQTSLAM